MSKRRSKKTSGKRSEPQMLHLVQYEITYEPIGNPWVKRLPLKVRERIEVLHDMAQTRPKEAISELLELKEAYPDAPVFYNYLAMAYTGANQEEKAEEIIRENYRKNPNYLFAKLNYADLCRKKGELDKIPEIFEGKFDLKELYPRRKTFHISEFVGFAGVMGMYFCDAGMLEPAKVYHQTLRDIAPKHPITKALGRELFRSKLRRMLRNLLRR